MTGREQTGKEQLRHGFTTGSCAAAASKAALQMLLGGRTIHSVRIMTPKGYAYQAEIVDISRNEAERALTCAVVKDGGDDPDVTSGSRICATVRLLDPGVQETPEQIGTNGAQNPQERIRITGGQGVGRITKPGLDQPVGEAAINSVPRKMIRANIEEVLREYGAEDRCVEVTISVPNGEELAAKTFNPKLGIVGGISIIGTTGIVEPMSDAAIVETIRAQIRVQKALGRQVLLAAPGNYGLAFLKEHYGIDENDVVMSSNFVFDTVRIAVEEGFDRMLYVGHVGKLVKVAGGIQNTHSAYGDHRMEILASILEDVTGQNRLHKVVTLPENNEKPERIQDLREKILDCVMTEDALQNIENAGLLDPVFSEMTELVKKHMEAWSDGKLQVESVIFTMDGKRACTEHAGEFFHSLRSR